MNYLSKFKNENELQNFIINRIKLYRTNKNITQAELAYILGMSEQNYGRIERGRYRASLYFVFNFCSKLDITLQEFFMFKLEKISKFEKETREFLENNKDAMLEFNNFINSYYKNDYKQ